MRTLLLGVLLVSASVASADLPTPVGTFPAHIRVGGAQTATGSTDPSIAFVVNVHDHFGNPIVASLVDVDFAACSDLRLCTAVSNGFPIDCSNRRVRGMTNMSGNVTLSIMGGGTNAGNTQPPNIFFGAGTDCVVLYADGVFLGRATAIVYDQNGAQSGGNGVNGLDIAIAKNDIGAAGLGAPYRGRSDYTADGSLNGADLAVLKSIIGQSALGLGSGAGCASGGAPASYCP